jgi:hypothetical protein
VTAQRSQRIALAVCSLLAVGLQFPGRLDLAAAALLLMLLAILRWDRPALRRLGNWRFWLVVCLFALAAGTLLARPTGHLGPVPYSLKGLEAAAILICRAATLYSVVVVWSRHLSHRSVARSAGRFRRLGTAFGLALNMVPVLADDAREAHGALRLRRQQGSPGRFRRLGLISVTLLVRACHLAEEAALDEALTAPPTGEGEP